MTPNDQAPWRLERGAIYGDVYGKRIDDRPADRAADLRTARLDGDALAFEDPAACEQALHDGVFRLVMPADFPTAAADLFARSFHLGPEVEPYGRFRGLTAERFGDPLLGFHERINQIEQFLLERRFWAGTYPPEITAAGEALTRIAGQVLRAVLALTDIPPKLWDVATGGCSEGRGSYHLTFNHYRPAMAGIGLASHKDDGFLTILRTTAAGLEVNRDDRWESVAPDPDVFVINFGLSMEVLTRHSARPVRAIMHRVRHQTADRSSFGHFSSSHCAPGEDQAGIHAFSSIHGLRRVCGSRELIDANDEEIYQGTRPYAEDTP